TGKMQTGCIRDGKSLTKGIILNFLRGSEGRACELFY
ncbi:MAG: hypothetical protein ACI81P_001304, partial [Neolewinella sp.]